MNGSNELVASSHSGPEWWAEGSAGALEGAAAARLLLLCFNVFVNLELGFIRMLDGPVLQLPEEQNQTSQFRKQHIFFFLVALYNKYSNFANHLLLLLLK